MDHKPVTHYSNLLSEPCVLQMGCSALWPSLGYATVDPGGTDEGVRAYSVSLLHVVLTDKLVHRITEPTMDI